MTVNEYVKKRFGRFIDQCTNEEIYVALLEYIKEAAKEKESNEGKNTKNNIARRILEEIFE